MCSLFSMPVYIVVVALTASCNRSGKVGRSARLLA